MKRTILAGALAPFFLLGAAGHAQQPAAATAAAAAEPQCELHIWPTARFGAHTSSVLGAFGVIGKIADQSLYEDKNDEDAQALRKLLEPKTQLATLQAADPVRLLGLPPSRLVAHEAPLREEELKSRTRHAASSAPCYAELIVGDIRFSDPSNSDRGMRVNFILNRFPARAPTPLTFRKGSGGKLYYFPPADPKLKPAAAEELVNTLKSSFQDFAKRAHAPR